MTSEQPSLSVIAPDPGGAADRSYAEAANAGARAATGDVLVFLDGSPAGDDWRARIARAFAGGELAALGGRVVTAAGGSAAGGSAGGSIVVPAGPGKPGFALLPLAGALGDAARETPADCDLVPRGCFAVRRTTFAELGGFDPAFADGDEVLDFCLRLRERDLQVVEDGGIVVHAGPAAWPRPADRDARRRAFLAQWQPRVVPRPNLRCDRRGTILRADGAGGAGRVAVPLPDTTVLVHGGTPADPDAFAAALARSRLRPAATHWEPAATAGRARELTEHRGEGYVAFVRADAQLAPNWLNALVDALERDEGIVAARDGGCVLIAPRHVPQHVRIDGGGSIDDAVDAWLGRAAALGRTTSPPRAVSAATPPPPFASIVMLSWNAPEYTEGAVASIARATSLPHEVIVVDNGSGPETRARLARLHGVRVVYNEHNRGFAAGCNQGAALARGTHVVWLNNDVVVTGGWLEALLALQAARPTIGISVPMSNNVHGHQRVADAPADLSQFEEFAAARSRMLAGRWYRADVVMGLCLCVQHEVLDEIGGMDPAYGVGNFEDVDYCVRARAAGYEIGVCEDALIYHFGSASFRANGIDYAGQTAANLTRFVERWRVRTDVPLTAAVLDPIRRGFRRASDYVALDDLETKPPPPNTPAER